MSGELKPQEFYHSLENDIRLYHLLSAGLFSAGQDHVCPRCSRFAHAMEMVHGWLSRVSEEIASTLSGEQREVMLAHLDYFTRLVRALPVEEAKVDQIAGGDCRLKRCLVERLSALLDLAYAAPRETA